MTNIPTDAEYLERLKKPITDEKLAELDDWYSKCPSNSLKFCDADYLAIRARLALADKALELARIHVKGGGMANAQRLAHALNTYEEVKSCKESTATLS